MKISNMRKLRLSEVKDVELSILKKVADICEQHGWNYSLYYGTLLGAIRHKGFIPWDDDIDVVMPREDYEQLVQYFVQNNEETLPLTMLHYKTTKGYAWGHIRICHSNYPAKSSVFIKPEKQFAYIDIIPFDYTNDPDADLKIRKTHSLCVFYICGTKAHIDNSLSFFKKYKFKLGNVISKLFHKPIISFRDNYFKQPYAKHYKYIGNVVWPIYFGKEVFDKEIFSSYIKVPFEKYEFSCFANYDKILTQIYGDYMTLPPEDQRVGHHHFDVYSAE